MATHKVRTVNLGGPGRTSLRMTEAEWTQVDRFAEINGVRWLEWAQDAVRESPRLPKVEAIRRAIRQALQNERAGTLEPAEEAFDHPFVNLSRFVDDTDLEAIKDDFQEVWAVDLDSVIIRFGFNRLAAPPESDPLMVIENKLRGSPHMAFAASFGAE